jgi:hypothetical protein
MIVARFPCLLTLRGPDHFARPSYMVRAEARTYLPGVDWPKQFASFHGWSNANPALTHGALCLAAAQKPCGVSPRLSDHRRGSTNAQTALDGRRQEMLAVEACGLRPPELTTRPLGMARVEAGTYLLGLGLLAGRTRDGFTVGAPGCRYTEPEKPLPLHANCENALGRNLALSRQDGTALQVVHRRFVPPAQSGSHAADETRRSGRPGIDRHRHFSEQRTGGRP